MKRFISPRRLTALTLLFSAFCLNAQLSSVGYFMDGTSNRHYSNPAFVPDKGYLSFPLIGQLGVNVQSSMGLANFLYPDPKSHELLTFMHPDVSADSFLSNFKKNNCLNTSINQQIIGFGIRRNKSFFDFDIALRADANVNIPKELFAFFKEGMSKGAGQTYDIRNLDVSALTYTEFAFGYARNITAGLSIGARAKFLVGLAGADARIDQLKISMNSDYWKVEPKVSGNLYVDGVTMEYDDNGYISGLQFTENYKSLRPAGYGMAFDFGLEYSLSSLHLSANVHDLGLIHWNKANGVSIEKEFDFSGFNNVSLNGTSSVSDQLDVLSDELAEFLDISTLSPNDRPDLSSGLNTRINLGAEYDILGRMLSAGLLYTHLHTSFGGFNECQLIGNFRLKRMLQLSAGYSILTDFSHSFGVALSLFNTFFVSWDNIPMRLTPQRIPIDELNSTLRIGVNIPLGGKEVSL